MATVKADIETSTKQKTLLYLMGSFFSLLFLISCVWLYLVSKSSVFVPSQSTQGTLFINGTASIGATDHDFICATLDWWPPDKCDYGTCSWGRASLLNLDLTNPILLNAIKAFSPLKIRMGGTLQDKVIYERQGEPCNTFVKNSSEMFGFSQGCLPMSRWDELNTFFKQAGAVVTFGLNALKGRTIASDGSAVGAWDPSDAKSLIRYTVNKGYRIHGWELGNELSGNGVGTRLAADQYPSDINTLQNIVENIHAGFEDKPLVLAPGGFFDANWFTKFIDKTPKSLQVVTQHIYNLGPGVDDHLIDKILDPSYLDGGSQMFSSLQGILKSSGTQAVAWVGEAGGAYNSGHNLVTNAFVFSFWYLDQLGMASSYDTKTYCRQTLIGGNYGLLNTTTFVPNPDYYSALLWHRLMGRNALSTSFSGTKKIRAYAHCSKATQGITLLLINLDGNTTFQVSISTENFAKNGTWTLQEYQSRRAKFARIHRGSKLDEDTREEYHLTAKDNDLHSQTVLLNGKILTVSSSGAIPPLEPIKVGLFNPITVAPLSIVFAQITNMTVPACV
ncbi:heparanase-like protein 3 isoform X1 [Hevea brasiliensis]|nr:heparanase-like protein 3 isoform X1 [Hevea brasiliensis]